MTTQFNLNREEKKIVSLAALGGMLEFYDFIIYGVFSVYFAQQFFPEGNTLLTVIESYVVFVLGYLARPLGGIIFSHVGDEHGRKKVLIITIVLMGFSSLGIGLMPTYAQIGLAAPLGLLGLRLLQGLAIGGELPSTYVYISEAMPGKRGSAFGITMLGVNAGLLLGMLINQLLNKFLSPAELANYGWRLPFIFGGMLCLISYKIRKTLQETAEFDKLRDKPEFPLAYLFKNHFSQLLAGTAVTGIMSGLVVIAIIFMPTYLHKILKIDNRVVSHAMPIVMLCNIAAVYLSGRLANLVSPYQILRGLIIASLVLVPVSFLAITSGYALLAGLIALGVLEGIAAMVIPLLLTYLFPAKVRLTGVAMSYNIGFTIFGGLSPIIISWSIQAGYDKLLVPLFYMSAILLICSFGLFYALRHSFEKIDG